MVNAQVIVSSVSVVVALVTYVLSRIRENRLKRADLVLSYSDTLCFKGNLFDVFSKIDYEVLQLSRDPMADEPARRDLIQLLDLFNVVAYSLHRRVISPKDLRGTTLWYAMLRCWESDEVKEFMRRVDKWEFDQGASRSAWRYYRSMAPFFKTEVQWQRSNLAPPVVEMVLPELPSEPDEG